MNVDDLREAMNAVRTQTADDPASIHGRKAAIFDLIFDSGIQIEAAYGALTGLRGLDVHYDDDMPDGVIEVRDREGRPIVRFVQDRRALGWYMMDVRNLRFTSDRGNAGEI